MLQKKIRLETRTSYGPIAALLVIASLVALPAAAAVFTVNLTNGATIDSRYRPNQSPSHPEKIMLLTEHGNWISLDKRLVTSIESDVEARGFGTVLDTDTIIIGYSINDAPAPGATGGAVDPTDRLIDYLRGRDSPATPFTVPQFVEPNSAGGIPLGFAGRTTPPISSRAGEPQVAGENQ